MATVTTPPKLQFRTMADVLKHLGDVPAERVRMNPYPGTATERDMIRIDAQEDRLYELMDGVLVERASSVLNAFIAPRIACEFFSYLSVHDLGIITNGSGPFRLRPALVRLPSIAFTSWERLPNRRIPKEPIADFAPNVVVELLCENHTRSEIALKLTQYFEAGTQSVWVFDPETRTGRIHLGPDEFIAFERDAIMSGDRTLPGLKLNLKKVYSTLD